MLNPLAACRSTRLRQNATASPPRRLAIAVLLPAVFGITTPASLPRTSRMSFDYRLPIGDDQQFNNVDFCAAEFDLVYREEGWRLRIPNRGFYQLVDPAARMTQFGGNEKHEDTLITLGRGKKAKTLIRRRILVREGSSPNAPLVPCSEPQYLDKNGAYIDRPTLDNMVFLTPLMFKKMPFSQLPIKQ